MLSLDLFDSKYEKKLHEGAVDDAEYARLKKLGEKIDYLKQARAKTKDAEMQRAIDGRIKQYNDERMEILSVRGMKEAEQPAQPQTQQTKGIGDIQDPRSKMAQLQQKAKKGPLANVGAGLKAFIKGEPEPMGEEQGMNPRALGVANFQRLVKANMGNIPTVSLEFIRPDENFKLDQKGLDLISDYYDGLENDQAKNYFIYRVLPSGDETLKVLKQLGWHQQTQQNLPGIPTQGELPLQEKKKSNSDDLEAGDAKVARELQKLRAQYPAARSDVEAVARAEIDSTERSQQQLSAIRGANEKQDVLLKQLVALDQEQGREISGLDKENNSLEQRLAQVQATNDRLQQAVGKMTGNRKAATKTKPADVSQKGSVDIAQGGIIDVNTPVAPAPDTTSAANIKPKTPSAMGSIVRTVTAPKAPSTAKDTEKVDKEPEPAPKPVTSLKALRSQQAANVDDFKLVGEHGGGIGPKKHWQSMMPEQSNPEDDDWYDDEDDQETELRSGDYVRDTMDGEHGEVFRMQGDPYERRVRILDRDGKGWYIEPSRLTRVDPTDPDIQRYFGKHRQRDMDEGWSDAVVARRTGSPRTPYSVYIKGRKWKDFANDDLARAVMNKLKAKFKADGRDPETITIAPTDMTEEALVEGIKDTAGATAVIACLLTGGSLTGCATSPQQTSTQQVLKTGQDIGRTVQTAKRITRAGTEAEVQQELRNILRGINRPEELNNSNIIRIWKRIQGQPPVQPEPQAPEYGPAEPRRRAQFEAREIVSKEDFVRERDRLLRMIGQETNPANKQILKSAIRQLENRAENEGWITIQNRMVREDSDNGEAVEMAIMRRMLVAHTDLIVEFGLDKVVQAIEEVAYNVGDVDEIGTSDVSGWVNQVKQILGAVNEGLKDPADNPCWKGYHPVGTKKKAGRTVPNCVPNANKGKSK
jgi:hypothetical protein